MLIRKAVSRYSPMHTRGQVPAVVCGMGFPNLVRQALRVSKLKQAELAEELGVTQGTVSRWLSGKAQPEVSHWLNMRQFLAKFDVEIDEEFPTRRTVPLHGYIGAGAQVIPVDGDTELDRIEPKIPVPDDTICVRVKGDSMYPRYFDGELLYYRSEPLPPELALGRECVIRLKNGQMLVKMFRRGTRPGLFTLESWNAPPMEDQDVEWVAPVEFVERR